MFRFLRYNEKLNAQLCIWQWQHVHRRLTEKHPVFISRKNVVLPHVNAKPHTAKLRQEKFWNLVVLFNPTDIYFVFLFFLIAVKSIVGEN